MRTCLPSGGRLGFFLLCYMSSNRHRSHPPHLPSGARRQAALSAPLGRRERAGTWPDRSALVSRPQHRNVIGTHGGSYAVYRALAVSAGALDPIRRPDLTNTHPAAAIGPFPQWWEPMAASSRSTRGAISRRKNSSRRIAEGEDIRPTIAVTRARLELVEMRDAIRAGRLSPMASMSTTTAASSVVKVAIDPVWHLPGVAARFGTTEKQLAPRAVRADRRNVPRTCHPAGSARFPAADRRHHGLFVRRCRQARRPPYQDHLPRA